jgi:tetratricopeptide (TPR) repeat protein
VDFFVSYAGADRPWAQWAASVLETDGFTVELDVWDWAPGTNAVEQMNGALERADRVLALWSPRYFDPSSFAGEELSAAFYANHDLRGRLVPVVIEKVAVGPLYRPLIFIDLSGLDEAAAGRELIARLRGETGRGQAHVFPGTPVRHPGQRPPVWRAPPRNPNFTGRDRMLEDLHVRLGAAGGVALTALHGMGGVGKTQLATEYAHRFAPDYDVVWWIAAEQAALIPHQFAELGGRFGLDAGLQGPEAVTAVLDALGRMDRWLLVFDNADQPADLQPYRPSGGGGHVLITSRHPGWGGIGARVEVDVFARGESVQLLGRRIANLGDELADALAEDLGDLPLALEQAAGYIETKGTPPERYLQLLRARREQLLGEGSVADHVLLDATWALSLEQLDPSAVRLLQAASFLAPEPVPVSLFGVEDELALEDALGHLSEYALVRRSGDALIVHRLVQASVLRSLAPVDRDEMRRAALLMLYAAVPSEVRDEPAAWPPWERLLPHVLAITHGDDAGRIEPFLTPWLIGRAGVYLQTRGEPGEAKHLLERGLRMVEQALGPDDKALVQPLKDYGAVLLDLGAPEAARQVHERSLRIAEQAYGPESAEAGPCLDNLAIALRQLGRADEAQPLQERALKIAEQTFGPDSTQVAAALSNLASGLKELGDPAAARPLLERALEIDERTSGPDHPNVSQSLNNLATVLLDLGDPVAARPLLERSLQITADAYGADHPLVAQRQSNLGQALRQAGDEAAALELLQSALQITEKAYGPDHPTVAIRLTNLAFAISDLGAPELARPLFERAFDITERTLGPGHPKYTARFQNLFQLLLDLGDEDAARALLARFEGAGG